MFSLQSQLLTPVGVPIANGSVVMTINTPATVIATSSPAPGSYTFNLDSSGNLLGSVYGAIELNPPSTWYNTTIYSGPSGTGSVVWSTVTWVVGPTQPYSGTLFPDVYALPQISINTVAGAAISGTPSVGALIIGTGAATASWQIPLYAPTNDPIFTGTVGINVVPSGAIFQVVNPSLSSSDVTALFDSWSGASGTALVMPIVIRSARGTQVSPSAVQTNDIFAGISGKGYNGSAYTGAVAAIQFNALENFVSTYGSSIVFTCTQIGSSSTGAVMVLEYTGLGFNPVTTPAATLHLPPLGVQAWDNGTGTAVDTGWSRISPNVIGGGNGTQGDYTATIKAAAFIGKTYTANIATKTTTYPITTSDYIIICTTNAFTVTLPTAVGISGQEFNIKNGNTLSSGNYITIATTSSQTIDGSSTETLLPLNSITVVSDGANWWVI